MPKKLKLDDEEKILLPKLRADIRFLKARNEILTHLVGALVRGSILPNDRKRHLEALKKFGVEHLKES